jgi:hypothetical protein
VRELRERVKIVRELRSWMACRMGWNTRKMAMSRLHAKSKTCVILQNISRFGSEYGHTNVYYGHVADLNTGNWIDLYTHNCILEISHNETLVCNNCILHNCINKQMLTCIWETR